MNFEKLSGFQVFKTILAIHFRYFNLLRVYSSVLPFEFADIYALFFLSRYLNILLELCCNHVCGTLDCRIKVQLKALFRSCIWMNMYKISINKLQKTKLPRYKE